MKNLKCEMENVFLLPTAHCPLPTAHCPLFYPHICQLRIASMGTTSIRISSTKLSLIHTISTSSRIAKTTKDQRQPSRRATMKPTRQHTMSPKELTTVSPLYPSAAVSER